MPVPLFSEQGRHCGAVADAEHFLKELTAPSRVRFHREADSRGYGSVDHETLGKNRHSMRDAILDGVEVLLLGLESDVTKIFRPIPERSVGIRLGAAHLCNAFGVAREPVQAH